MDCNTILKPICNYEDSYFISNSGNVFSVRARRFLNILTDTSGYSYVSLNDGNKVKNISIHRLVASAFIDKENGKDFVNHIDGIKSNNNVSNLEWCTRSENEIHASKILLKLNNFNKKTKANTSGHCGVSLKKGKTKNNWFAYCNYKNKRHSIGYFNTAEEASIARKEYMEINGFTKERIDGIAKSQANPTTNDVFEDALKLLK